MRIEHLKAAADEIVAAALLGEGWEAALSGFAGAAGAHGAVIMRNRPDRLISVIRSEEIAEPVSAFLAGRVPPNSRYARVWPGLSAGFRIDHDDYSDDELAADPYYQEFLRPRGFFWHANAVLKSISGNEVEFGLKRRLEAGPYDRADATLLGAVLPDLRGAAALASHTFEAEGRGVAELLRHRGDPVYRIDARGCVTATETAEPVRPSSPLRVVGRRLIASDPAAQDGVDRAVRRAVRQPAKIGWAHLTGPDGHRHILQVVPLPGRARDVFLATSAVAVLIDAGGRAPLVRLDASAVADTFALTDREANVACLVAEGLAPAEIAAHLGIEVATARVHLRRIFEKTGTRRQSELAALLARLLP